MIVDDPLLPILFNPGLTALAVLVGGAGTLIIAVRGNLKILTRNKAFLLGDLIVLPLCGWVIATFYGVTFSQASLVTLPYWNLASLVLAIIITALFGYRYRLFSKRWFAHGLFFCAFAYIFVNFFSKGLFQLIQNGHSVGWFLWVVGVSLLALHLTVGSLWPKRF